jgi:hypothetical protein
VVLVHEGPERGDEVISRPPEAVDFHPAPDVGAERGFLDDADNGKHHAEDDERLADANG